MVRNTQILNGTTLTVTRQANLNIDIAKLADAFEQQMIDGLDDILSVDLDLSDEEVDYIMNDEKLMNKVLSLVIAEMFKRIDKKQLTFK